MSTFDYLVDAVLTMGPRKVGKQKTLMDVEHKKRHNAALEFAKKMFSKKKVYDMKSRNSRNGKICKVIYKFGVGRWGSSVKRARSSSFTMDSWISSMRDPLTETETIALEVLHARARSLLSELS